MREKHTLHAVIALLLGGFAPLAFAPAAGADATILEMSRCQQRIAGAGVTFARTALRGNLKCTNEVTKCRIQCDQGLLGTGCDPDDPDSTPEYRTCLDRAQAICNRQSAKIANAEGRKRAKIVDACNELTVDQLCNTDSAGLNFALLNAGCRERDPNYTCNLVNMVDCVGGPLEAALVGKISALLDPGAGAAVATLGLEAQYPDLPKTHTHTNGLLAGATDIIPISGVVGDELIVSLGTLDDGGPLGTPSTLHADMALLATDGFTVLASTTVEDLPCPVPNACGEPCPQLRRVLPFSGTFFLAVTAVPTVGCPGGQYRLTFSGPTSLGSPVFPSPSAAFIEPTAGVLD
jgi:hypothetical protein